MMTMNTSGPGLGALSVRNVPALGAPDLSDTSIDVMAAQVAEQMKQVPSPITPEVLAGLFKLYSQADRWQLAQAIISAGGDSQMVSEALAEKGQEKSPLNPFGQYAWAWGLLSTASGALSGYHGYKRNDSIGWALAWFVLGSFFPIVTPVIAVAQGFGEPK